MHGIMTMAVASVRRLKMSRNFSLFASRSSRNCLKSLKLMQSKMQRTLMETYWLHVALEIEDLVLVKVLLECFADFTIKKKTVTRPQISSSPSQTLPLRFSLVNGS